jgi:hypothetical protein
MVNKKVLPLCFTPCDGPCKERLGKDSRILNSGQCQMEMSGQLQAAAAVTAGKECLWQPLDTRLDSHQSRSGQSDTIHATDC